MRPDNGGNICSNVFIVLTFSVPAVRDFERGNVGPDLKVVPTIGRIFQIHFERRVFIIAVVISDKQHAFVIVDISKMTNEEEKM
jgi:hypothetical protein